MHANIIHDAKYGRMCCGVSRSGTHNPIKCSTFSEKSAYDFLSGHVF